MSHSDYPAPYVVTVPIARPVHLCKRHAKMFLERAAKGGIEAAMAPSHEDDHTCESCVNEAKRKKK